MLGVAGLIPAAAPWAPRPASAAAQPWRAPCGRLEWCLAGAIAPLAALAALARATRRTCCRAGVKICDIRPEIYRVEDPHRSFFYSQCPPENPKLPEFAFFGQSNVGKSSLLNFLCNRRKITTISKNPGHTKLIHHILCEKSFYLVDLPGTGTAEGKGRALKQMSKVLTAYVRHRNTLAQLFYLVDGSKPFQDFDLQGIKWLADTGADLTVVLTKMDTPKRQPRGAPEDPAEEFVQRLEQMPQNPWRLGHKEMPLVFKCSVKQRTGREALLNHIADMRKGLIVGARKAKKKQQAEIVPPAIR